MSWESWSIGVFIRASSNVSQVMAGISSSSARANTGIGQTNRLLSQQEAQIRRMRAMQAGAYIGAGVAAVGATAIVAGVRGAAQLQMAMTTVGQATGSTRGELAKLQQQVLDLSDVTAQSASTIAQEMATAAKAGLNSYQRLFTAFPQIARFADVQYFAAKASGRSMSPVEAVNIATQFAHYFQAYSGKPLENMLNQLNKLMFTQPEDMTRLLNQGKYFIPLGRVLGLSMRQNMELLAAMGQTGFLRGRGGTGVENTLLGAINATTMTGHLQGARARALRELGIIDSSGRNVLIDHGRLSWDKLTKVLNAAATRLSPVQYASDLQSAFQRIATQFLAVFTSPAVQSQMRFINAVFDRMGTVDEFFSKFFNNLIPQLQRFGTNFTNLLINIFLPTLPYLTAAFRKMADVLQALGDWFGAHPKAGIAAAITAFGATAAAAIFAARQMWLLNTSIIAVGRSAGGRAVIGGAEGAAGGGFLGGMAGKLRAFLGLGPSLRTTGGLYPEVEALIARGFMARLAAGIGSKFIPIVGWAAAAVTAVNAIVSVFTHLPSIATNVHNWWVNNQYQIGYTIGVVFATIGKMLQNAIMGLVSGTGSAISTFASNWSMLLSPGGQQRLMQLMLQNAQKAQGQWNAGPGTRTFGAGLQSGMNSVFGPGAAKPVINMYINDPNFHFPNGTTPEHAKKSAGQLFDTLLEHARTHGGTTGIQFATHPYFSPAGARAR